MKIRPICFNTYLAWSLAALLGLTAMTGCSLFRPEKKPEASLRFHLESNLDGTERTQPIAVGRTAPFAMTVETRAFLSEFNIDQATVVDAPGGFVLSVQFNHEGAWILEQYSTAHKGKRVAIAAEFGELRWIASPIMRDRISNGLLVFTPDTTREEADKIASGVNRVAELVRKGRK
jgi:preprotein translocase subunit SecD